MPDSDETTPLPPIDNNGSVKLASPEGTLSDVSHMPPEVQHFIGTYTLTESVVAVG